MKIKMASASGDLTNILLQNIENPIQLLHESAENMIESWSKSLKDLPLFTIKEIDQHRLNSGKNPGTAIIKTLKGEKV